MAPDVGDHPSDVMDRVGAKLHKHGGVTSVVDDPGHAPTQDGSMAGQDGSGQDIERKEQEIREQTQQKLKEQRHMLEKRNIQGKSDKQKQEEEEQQRKEEEAKEAFDKNQKTDLKEKGEKAAEEGQRAKAKELKEKGVSPELADAHKQISQNVSQDKVDQKAGSMVEQLTKPVVVEANYVGWKDVGGWDERTQLNSEEELDDLLSKSTLLESYIGDKFFGDWYHNTVLIVMTALFSWIVGRYGGGIGWLTIVLAFTATWYRTSIRRLRRNVRDDVTRVMSIKKLETDTETLDWLNSFLTKFWIIYEPVLSEQIVQTANQILADATPGFIESISLETFTLGTKPPRIDSVRTFPKTDEDVSVMDWKFSFTPNDVEDLTTKQLKVKVNPKVVLGVRVGKGVISKSLPILVEDMSFSGLMRVRIKMMSTFPHVQTLDVSFLTPPDIDFVLKPIGGETFGFDINIVPGLSKFIKDMIDSNVGPMLYAPNAFQINVEQMLAGSAADSAIGVMAVTVNYAKQIKGSEAIGNTIDPYIRFSFNERDELCRTSVKSNTKNPTWRETKFLLVKSLSNILTMQLYDFNDHRKDKQIGVVNFPLETLKERPDQDGIMSEILAGTRNKGGLQYNVHWYPVLEAKTLEDGTVEPPPETKSGIVRLIIHQAKDLDAKKSLVGQLSTYAEIYMDKTLQDKTKTVKRNNNPLWEFSKEVICQKRNKATFKILIKDARGMSQDPVIGEFTTSLQQLLSAESGHDWYDLKPAGKIRMEAKWNPVALGDISGGAYVEPIGVMRVFLDNARDLRNLEKVGKIDPYVRVLQGGFQRARTPAVDSTLDPDFDQYVYVTIQNPQQELVLNMMDVQKVTKDRSVGQTKFECSKFAIADENGEYKASQMKKFSEDLVMPKRGPKGKLNYGVQFLPAMQIMSPDEQKQRQEEIEKKESLERQNNEQNGDGKETNAEKANQQPNGNKTNVSDEHVEKPRRSTDSAASSTSDNGDGIIMPLEEQMQYKSGVLGLVIENIKRDTDDGKNVRIYFDKMCYASYTSPKLRRTSTKVMETCDFLIREMDWSNITLNLVPKDDTTIESTDVLATCTIPTETVLRKSYNESFTIKLTGRGGNAEVTVRARYFPVPDLQLAPEETIDNQGQLRIDLFEAENVEAADRSGKSDPYCEVRINDHKVFKTDIKKKTLNPVWNEFCQVDLRNKLKDVVELRIYDWDIGPAKDDFLGSVKLDLKDLEAMKKTPQTLSLDGHRGHLKIQLEFRPGYVKMDDDLRENTSTVGVRAGTIVGGAGGRAMAGAHAGAHAGKKVFKTAGKFGHRLRHRRGGDDSEEEDNHNENDRASVDHSKEMDQDEFADRRGSVASRSNESQMGGVATTTASSEGSSSSTSAYKMSITGATGYDQAILLRFFQVDKRDKELFKCKVSKSGEVAESFSFRATNEARFLIKAYHHKSIGRDTEIGQFSFGLTEASEQMRVDLGQGQVLVSLTST